MKDPKEIVLCAQLIHNNQIIGSTEKALHFFEETESEEITIGKTLEETINDFISSIQQVCREKSVAIIDEIKLAFDLTIKLLSAEAEDRIPIEVPVTDQKEEELDDHAC